MNRPKWIWPKWIRAVTAVVLLAAGVAGCSGSSGTVAGRIDVDGQAEISRPGEDRREGSGGRAVGRKGRRDRDGAPVGRELDRIVDQLVEATLQQATVAGDLGEVAGGPPGDGVPVVDPALPLGHDRL